MRLLLAPDKFKGTFSAGEICEHVARGAGAVPAGIEIERHPMADGGEGTLEILLQALGGNRRRFAATGPLGDPIEDEVGVLPDGSFLVESSRFIGLATIDPGRRDPEAAGSHGLGQVLDQLLRECPPRILVGLGGSATVDGGAGLSRALGFRLVDSRGRELPGRGGDLPDLDRIEPPETGRRGPFPEVLALCDVLNPLLGPDGAARVFGPQKGASDASVARLEQGLAKLAGIMERDLDAGPDLGRQAMTGAAGGLGAGLMVFAGARLVEGARYVSRATGLEEAVGRADLVVTGEGEVDLEGAPGKVVPLVLEAAGDRDVPVIVLCGAWRGSRELIRGKKVKVLDAKARIGPEWLFEAGKSLVRRGFSGHHESG